jgi:HPt (histidine-containing phosphotransfer) domain-containing protein
MFSRLKTRTSKFLKKAWHSLTHSRPLTDTQRPAPDVAQLAEEDLKLESLTREFSRELLAQLLLELPAHRARMAQAYQAGNYRGLDEEVHQVLGAVVYCEADELEACLRELRLALQTENPHSIDSCLMRTLEVIDTTLRGSGFR